MRWRILILLLAAIVLIDCGSKEPQPVYSNTPFIEVANLEYIAPVAPSLLETLVLSLKINDGDFDLGNDYNFEPGYVNFSRITGQRTDASTSHEAIRYSDRATIDTLPPFEHPYNCTRWLVIGTDTIYVQRNPSQINILVQYFYHENNSWKEFDWTSASAFPNCSESFSARFPRIPGAGTFEIEPFSLISNGRNTLVLRYTMRSFAFTYFFSGMKIKLRVRILDRAKHSSNTIETPELQL